MDLQQTGTQKMRTTRPGGKRMARARKSPYERIAEKKREAEQAENEVAALKAQIRSDERRKDTRRKVLDGAMSFAHARIDPEYREVHANMLHKVGAAMKGERARTEAAELEKWVRAGCQDVDIDQRVEEVQRSKPGTAPEPVKASAPAPRKPSGVSPQG
jgi:hypothetical protein